VKIDDDFVGKNIIGEIIDREIKTYVYHHSCTPYREVYYFIKLPKGNVVKRNRADIKKINK
jgi:uncharacterized FAD-dependent dehydrogenase